MKKLLSFILTVALLISVIPMGAFTFTASAETATSGTTGDCNWSLDGTVLTISGNGEMGDYGCDEWGRDITQVIIENGVTSIGGYAFYGCDSLASITIPDSVTVIDDGAFSICDSLTSITIPDSVTIIDDGAFYGCTSLTSITIPDSVTSIGDSAFRCCESLTSITIPDSVTSIGVSAFGDCEKLQNIEVDDDNKYFSDIEGILFNKDKTTILCYPAGKTATSYTIPDSVISIGDWTFYECSSLTSITIPDSVISIGDYAFYFCESLTSITIPDSVSSIGGSVFYNTAYCNDASNWENDVLYIGKHLINAKDSLSGEYTIKSGTKTIAGSAFSLCTSLTSITILDNVTSIGNEAFYSCISLTSITIPDSVISIGDRAFCFCISLTSITIPDSVTSIGASAFEDCDSLQNIEVDDDSKYFSDIEDILFNKDKTTLICYPASKTNTSYTIPDGVASIGRSAFNGCTSLTSITIPDSVTSIGYLAFAHCDSLQNVYYRGSKTNKEKISINSYNDSLTNATWYYNSCIGTKSHSYNSGKVTKKATCKATGVKTYTCSVCKDTKTSSIAKVAHKYTTTTTQATLKNNGGVVKKCAVCGDVAGTTVIKAANSISLSATSYTYDGKVKTPTVTVKDSAGNKLKKNVDYTVTAPSGRKNAGTYKVVITLIGNYTGTKTLSFKINPAKLGTVSLSATSYTYNGKVKSPTVTVKNAAGTKLKKNVDYTLTSSSGRKNVGTYTVTIKGKGNYTGTKTLTFKINPPKTSVSKLTAGKKSITVNISKKSIQVTGYQVQYSTSKKFTSAKTKVVNYKTTKVALKSLSAKKTYYVRVRTYKTVSGKKYYSGWSTYKYVKTK